MTAHCTVWLQTEGWGGTCTSCRGEFMNGVDLASRDLLRPIMAGKTC